MGNLGKGVLIPSLLTSVVTIVACSSGSQKAFEPVTINSSNGKITFLRSAKNPSATEKIIGTNELEPVINNGANIPEKYRPLIDAFGKIDMGCTATHIGNGVVITAGHCFEAPEVRTDHVSCAGNTVEWGLRVDKPAYLVSNCVEIIAYELNDSRDYAIFLVDKIPPVKFDYDLSARPVEDTKITLFGFPQARPMEWSKYCVVKPSTNGNYGTDQFSHQCDTEPGNSGSTVINDDNLKIIGIHDGGLAPWNYATYLYNTPLAEVLSKPLPTPSPVPTSTTGEVNQYFGPFDNSLNQVLTTLPVSKGSAASFTLDYNTESNFDFVHVEDANGVINKYTGANKVVLTNLKTPVTISIITDSVIKSKKVSLLDISFSN